MTVQQQIISTLIVKYHFFRTQNLTQSETRNLPIHILEDPKMFRASENILKSPRGNSVWVCGDGSIVRLSDHKTFSINEARWI